MDDEQIISLYLERDEEAITQTNIKYGSLCRNIANNILHNTEDTNECINESYYKLWNSIPPEKPLSLSAYLVKIVRNLSLDRLRFSGRKKRGSDNGKIVFDELQECIPDPKGNITDDFILKEALNKFIGNLNEENRLIFMRRYWYMYSVKDIAHDCSLSESNVKTRLFRMRNELKIFLEKEGINV